MNSTLKLFWMCSSIFDVWTLLSVANVIKTQTVIKSTRVCINKKDELTDRQEKQMDEFEACKCIYHHFKLPKCRITFNRMKCKKINAILIQLQPSWLPSSNRYTHRMYLYLYFISSIEVNLELIESDYLWRKMKWKQHKFVHISWKW